jgi:hypothetical protein
VERIRQFCVRSHRKSTARRNLELDIPKTTIQNVIHKRLRLHDQNIHLTHEIKPDDRPKRCDFASLMLNKIDDDEIFYARFVS